MKYLFSISLLACLIFSSCTKDSGSVIASYTKREAVYGDIDEIRSTTLIEASKTISNPGKIYIGDEFLLIGEEGKGIHIYDNSTPSNPQNTGYMNIPFCKEYYVSGTKIYAESQYDLVKIDISNPSQPFVESRVKGAYGEILQDSQGRVVVGFTSEDVTEKIKINSAEQKALEETNELFFDYEDSMIPASSVPSSFAGTSGGMTGTINRITVHSGHVFVASANKIHVFSDGASMTKVNDIDTWDVTETLYPHGDYIFAGGRNSMKIYDVRNPEVPTEESTYWHTTSCDPVLPIGDLAYITVRTGDFSNCPGNFNALEVVSIENITNPQRRQLIELETPYGMSMIDGILYVGNGENGLVKFDASTPDQLSLIETDNSVQAYDVIAHPTISNLILTAGPDGINQYEYDSETLEFTLIGHISVPV